MSIATIFLLIIGIAYGILTISTGIIVQLQQKEINLWASILMIIGGILTAGSIIFKSILSYYAIYLLIIGLLLIHAAAINNGFKMYGRINIKHHLIRLSVSILIIVLFVVQ